MRPWVFYDTTISICPECYRRVEGKIVFDDAGVQLLKRCPRHGRFKTLLADDVAYYRQAREVFLKPSEMPRRFGTPVRWGCPYDCGLCTDHEQHSCLSLVELGDPCNLECPICYAGSGPGHGSWHSLETIERMLDAVVEAEGEPDVAQISGGEPTIHPQFFEVLDAARRRPIRHLMLNTNGLRIAGDAAFAERLASYGPGFEVYLQFDSLRPGALRDLRGADLVDVRLKALDRLDALGLSTTLVVTVKRGANDDELGAILEFALTRPSVRGVTVQPIQEAGRLAGYDPQTHRLTLTEVRRRILEQTSLFRPEDVVPVPCHPDAIAMAYGLRQPDGGLLALTGMLDPQTLVEGSRATIAFERDPELRRRVFDLFSLAATPEAAPERLRDLLCCLPRVDAPSSLGYGNLFRLIILEFQDAASFDVRSVKKSCVHIVHPRDGRMIPFDTYNLFYRGALEAERLNPLRAEAFT